MVYDSTLAALASASLFPPARHMSWGSEVWSTGLCGAWRLLIHLGSLRNPGQSQPRRTGTLRGWYHAYSDFPLNSVIPNADISGGHLSCILMYAGDLDNTQAPHSLRQNEGLSQHDGAAQVQESLHWLPLNLHKITWKMRAGSE